MQQPLARSATAACWSGVKRVADVRPRWAGDPGEGAAREAGTAGDGAGGGAGGRASRWRSAARCSQAVAVLAGGGGAGGRAWRWRSAAPCSQAVAVMPAADAAAVSRAWSATENRGLIRRERDMLAKPFLHSSRRRECSGWLRQ